MPRTNQSVPPSEMKRASDILGDLQSFDADWTLDDARTDFILLGYELRDTGFGQAAILLCERDGEEHRFVTWGRVVLDQLEKIKEYPILARVDARRGKEGFYYTLY